VEFKTKWMKKKKSHDFGVTANEMLSLCKEI